MTKRRFNLAIETSSRAGSVAIGVGDEIIEQRAMAQSRPGQPRKGAELMPAIAELCEAHHVTPGQLDEVYVSVGPGSFTGLRVAVTTAKVLAQTLGCKLVAVPTVDVIAANMNVGANEPGANEPDLGPTLLAVVLNVKRQTFYGGLFRQAELADQKDKPLDEGGWWELVQPAALTTIDELLQQVVSIAGEKGDAGLTLVGDPLPEISDPTQALLEQAGVTLGTLTGEHAVGQASSVYTIARQLRSQPQIDPELGGVVDAIDLVPLYIRQPEAVELWNKRHGPG